MRGLKSAGQLQRFASVHSVVQNLFRVGHHLLRAAHARRRPPVRCFDSGQGVSVRCCGSTEPVRPPVQVTSATHSAATLHYFLLAGRPRLEPLRVFDSRRVPWAGRVVTFYVLGTSHAVLVEQDDTALTELLTCAAGDLGAQALERRTATSDSLVVRTVDHLRYDCRLSPVELDGADRLRGDFASADQLAVNYEAAHGAAEPMTHIGWRVAEAALLVETLHTYPHEGRGVRSESTFRLTTEGPGLTP